MSLYPDLSAQWAEQSRSGSGAQTSFVGSDLQLPAVRLHLPQNVAGPVTIPDEVIIPPRTSEVKVNETPVSERVLSQDTSASRGSLDIQEVIQATLDQAELSVCGRDIFKDFPPEVVRICSAISVGLSDEVVAEVCRAYQTLLDMGVDSVTAAGSLRLHRVTSRNSPEFHECVMRCTAMVQDDTQARRPQAPSGAVLF